MKHKKKAIKKDYYALYLPINNEEIKVGDRFSSPESGTNMYPADRIENGIIYTKNPHGQKKFYIEKEKLQKSRMFLCTKTIREGKAFDKSAGWCQIVKIFNSVANIHYSYSEEESVCKLSRPHSSLISVVGEISPKAVWIKNGDKFSLGDIKCNLAEEMKQQDGFYQRGVNDIHIEGQGQIQMKCPTCKSCH